MTEQLSTVGLGYKVDGSISILHGNGAPGGDAGEEDAALVSSIYGQDDLGKGWIKKTSGSGTDKWVRIPTADDLLALSFRSELVMAGTGDAAPGTGSVIDLVTNPFGDDDAPTMVATDFTVDQHILFGIGGTPKLMRVSVVAAPNITVVDADDALADNDNLVIRNYLPDTGDGQEKDALIHYNGSSIIKLADFNWSLADGINLTAGWVQQNGTILASDTIEVAIEKLAGNQIDLTTLSGVAQGAINLGVFTGVTIADNQTIKQALQALETALELIQGGAGSITVIAAGTPTTVSKCLVDPCNGVEWEVCAFETAAEGTKEFFKHTALHNGTSAADATEPVAFKTSDKLKLVDIAGLAFLPKLSGAGAAQDIGLQISATAGITVKVRRTSIP